MIKKEHKNILAGVLISVITVSALYLLAVFISSKPVQNDDFECIRKITEQISFKITSSESLDVMLEDIGELKNVLSKIQTDERKDMNVDKEIIDCLEKYVDVYDANCELNNSLKVAEELNNTTSELKHEEQNQWCISIKERLSDVKANFKILASKFTIVFNMHKHELSAECKYKHQELIKSIDSMFINFEPQANRLYTKKHQEFKLFIDEIVEYLHQ